MQRLEHVHGDPDRPGAVRDPPGDGLPDPPRRVRRELEPAPVLEAVNGLHEPEVALLNEIQEGEPASEIALGHRDDQPEVGLRQFALGLPDHPVLLGDPSQELAELLTREPGLGLQRSNLPSASAARRPGLELPDALAEPPQFRHELAHQGGLDRKAGHDPLDGLAFPLNPPPEHPPCRRRATSVPEPAFEGADLPLEPSEAGEGGQDAPHLPRLGLPAFGQEDQLLDGDLLPPHPIRHSQQCLDRGAAPPQGPKNLHLARLDAPADRDLLDCSQERNLPDFCEVQPNRFLRCRRSRFLALFDLFDRLGFLIEKRFRRTELHIGPWDARLQIFRPRDDQHVLSLPRTAYGEKFPCNHRARLSVPRSLESSGVPAGWASDGVTPPPHWGAPSTPSGSRPKASASVSGGGKGGK